eukprot:7494244-Ditylum_brightwellii.AAC.1
METTGRKPNQGRKQGKHDKENNKEKGREDGTKRNAKRQIQEMKLDEQPGWKTVDKVIQERSIVAVDEKEKYETPVSIKFVVEKKSILYIRAEFIELFKTTQETEAMASLAQLDGDGLWGTVKEVPKDKEFLTTLK